MTITRRLYRGKSKGNKLGTIVATKPRLILKQTPRIKLMRTRSVIKLTMPSEGVLGKH